MKIGGAVAVGIVIASLVLYWIRPVDNSTIAIVTTVCCGLSVGVASLITGGRTGGNEK